MHRSGPPPSGWRPRAGAKAHLAIILQFILSRLSPRHLSHSLICALILTAAWRNIGYFATIFLAGLQGIDTMYYEAARIDGAGAWGCFRRITLPLLRPTTLFVVIMSVILSFQVFALVYVMTGGGPAGYTSVIVFYLSQQAFTYFRMGYACAVGYVLFGISFSLTLLQFKFFGKQVEM